MGRQLADPLLELLVSAYVLTVCSAVVSLVVLQQLLATASSEQGTLTFIESQNDLGCDSRIL